MCGILGTINSPFDKVILERLNHRGPDDYGIDDLTIGSDVITLGHKRLSILDTSDAGHQPMSINEGANRIIFNGEIYNHLDLRRELCLTNFNGHSDTESILHYIAGNGIDSISKFNGIFAFAYLDIKRQKLFIARDKYGVKPLYYYFNQQKRVFVFSSEIKAMLPLIPNQQINTTSVNTYLKLRYNPSPQTIYSDVLKVKPGEILRLDLKSFSLGDTQNLNFPVLVKPDKNKPKQYWVDQLTDKIESAVTRQMMSDVPIGSFLSGGLDSALITIIAQKYSETKIKTFCVGFKDAAAKDDEIDDARRSAQIIGTDHYETIIDPKDYLSFLSTSTYFMDEPNGTAATMAQYQVSKLASQHVKVCLAGQGADELLLGYPRFRAEMDRKKYLPILRIANLFKFVLRIPGLYRYKRAVDSLLEKDELKRFIKVYTVFQDHEIEKLLKLNLYQSTNSAKECLSFFYDQLPKELISIERMSLLDTFTWLPDELLMYGDKMTMATSVEMRVPFLDNEVVDLIQKIPHYYKIKGNTHKYLLKEVAKKWLPDEIICRPKKGFIMPILQWFQEDMHEELCTLLLSDHACIYQFFDKRYVQKLLLSYKLKQENDYRKLLLILHFEIFLNTYYN